MDNIYVTTDLTPTCESSTTGVLYNICMAHMKTGIRPEVIKDPERSRQGSTFK